MHFEWHERDVLRYPYFCLGLPTASNGLVVEALEHV